MSTYSVSENEIFTARFYFFLLYTDTALGNVSSKLTYALKSFSAPKFHDQGCMLAFWRAACFVSFLYRNGYYNGLKRAHGEIGTE